MIKCKGCEKEIISINRAEFCSQKCYRSLWTRTLKEVNPSLHRRRLDKQNKRRRDIVRKRLGLPLDHLQVNQSGKGFKVKEGYIYLLRKDHPNCAKSGYIAEHVFLMSESIGRPLNKFETVHHKNGIRKDNRLENLELWSHSHPPGQRVEDKVEWAKEFLEFYGYKVIKE